MTAGAVIEPATRWTVARYLDPAFRRGLVYLATGLPTGVAAFAVAVAGLSLGVATAVIGVGFLVLGATLHAVRGLATMERGGTEWATGTVLPAVHHRTTDKRGWRRLLAPLADRRSWWDLAYAVVAFPVRLATFVVAAGWLGGGAAGVLYVFWQWALPADVAPGGVLGHPGTVVAILVNSVLGGVLLVTAPAVVRTLVLVRARLTVALLTDATAELAARAARMESGRRSAVAAEARTLRRLERDLHDGPQQRLVRLRMDLEAVARRLDDDPDRARSLVAEAIEQSRETLDELRTLSRGIAPPILADRGLGPAVMAAAARCPIEAVLDVRLPGGGRLDPVVETAAYFTVTEALTNVAKHAGATACAIRVELSGDDLVVEIHDDGRGGAHVGKGHGLAGLTDRLATVDAELEVLSPPGGPTTLTARIPQAGI